MASFPFVFSAGRHLHAVVRFGPVRDHKEYVASGSDNGLYHHSHFTAAVQSDQTRVPGSDSLNHFVRTIYSAYSQELHVSL